MKKLLSLPLVFVVSLGLLWFAFQKPTNPIFPPHQPYPGNPSFPPSPPTPPQPEPEKFPSISIKIPEYQNYDQIIAQLNKWKEESAGLASVGTYGKSSKGKDLYYIRVKKNEGKKKVLITAGIHGNEPLSTSTVMGYIGTLLSEYGKNPEITELIKEREIFFIPVICPDSYPHSRACDGEDPNRNFPTLREPNKASIPPIQALRSFFLEQKFNAAWSGHTFGRMYLTPWGDNTAVSPNEADFQRIVGEMGKLANYRVIRACQIYGSPIYGTEVDWYYRNGAFAIVVEYGTHQSIPSKQDIQSEFDRTWKAFLLFTKEAPLVVISPAN